MLQCEQAGQQADHARADHQDVAATNAVAQVAHVMADEIDRGVEQAVGADRPHLGDVDAQDRVEVGRQGDEDVP